MRRFTSEELKETRARVVVDKKEDAIKTAKEWSDHQGTVWNDGSRLECGAVGAALAFRTGERWVKRGTCLGKNKEVFDAEVSPFSRLLNSSTTGGGRDSSRRYSLT